MVRIIDRTPTAGTAVRKQARHELPLPAEVRVNGTLISRATIARETQNHPAADPAAAWNGAARALVIRELLLQEARRLGIAAEPETDADGRRETGEEASLRELIEREVEWSEPDDAACRRDYEQDPQRYRSPALYAVRHILVTAPPDDAAARAAARDKCLAIRSAVAADPVAFPRIAAEHSACPSRSNGGHLGQISRGQTVPELEAALDGLHDLGLAPEPIETRYGFHVVVLDARLEGRPLPFELVRERIARRLAEQARRTAIRSYIAALAERADISGHELGQRSQ